MARLGDICKLNMGQSPDSASYNEAGIGMPFFQGNADFGEFHPTVRIWCNSPSKIANSGDILISVRAPIGALNIADVRCCIGRGLAALTVDESRCTKEYLWHAISSRVDELNGKGTGSTFKAISKNILAETDIPLPSLTQQKYIATLIDKTDKLISLRKQQLAKLDELVKARFVELFGVCNNQTSIKESGLTISDGNYSSKYPKSEEFVESGIPFIRANNLKNGTVIDEDMYYITPEKHKMLLKGHLKPNDVLITTRGNIGQVAIVPEKHNDSNINAQIVLLRDENRRFIPQFLLWALQTEEVKSQYLALQTGTALKQLPVGRLEQVKIKEPPIKQQGQFAAFVEQTDKSKLTIQQSLDKLETLKKALMQKYFG